MFTKPKKRRPPKEGVLIVRRKGPVGTLRKVPIPRHGRGDPIKTCTFDAGGSLPRRFSASNVRRRPKPGREACDPRRERERPL